MSEPAGSSRVISGPTTRGMSSPTTPAGTSVSPTAQVSQPRSSSTLGTAMSSANQEAGTAAAAKALRTTTGLPITSFGRKPWGGGAPRR